MEALAYLPEPIMDSASDALTVPLAAEIAVKHDYRDIYIDKNTQVTIDLEEIKRNLEREIYKPLYEGLMMGG